MPAPTTLWWVCAGAAVAVIATYPLLPTTAQAYLYDLVTFSAAVALAVAAYRSTGKARLAWALLALGQAFYTAGDVTWNLAFARYGEVPAVSYIDALYLANYPFTAVALLIFANLRQAIRRLDASIDAMIAGVAGALAIWMLLLPLFSEPGNSVGESLVYLAYPVGDLMVVVLVARLAIGSGSPVWSMWLLLLGYVLIVIADLVFASFSVRSFYANGSALDLTWLYGYLALALAALHPSARVLGMPAPASDSSLLYRRIVFLWTAGLLPPVLFFINIATDQHPPLGWFVAGSLVLYLLMLVRMFVSIRERDEQLRSAKLPWSP